MKIELSEENARRLLWVANLLEVSPDDLLNEWMLSDWLKDFGDPLSGNLRCLYEEREYDTEKQAKRVAVRLAAWERQQGHYIGLPEIRVRKG